MQKDKWWFQKDELLQIIKTFDNKSFNNSLNKKSFFEIFGILGM